MNRMKQSRREMGLNYSDETCTGKLLATTMSSVPRSLPHRRKKSLSTSLFACITCKYFPRSVESPTHSPQDSPSFDPSSPAPPNRPPGSTRP